MKTFDDLVFKQHAVDKTGKHARITFDNGYGISVLSGGEHFYTADGTYEVGVLKNDFIYYGTPITDDVSGYQTPEQITEIMKEIQSYTQNQY